jgi:putative PIN family toxin of toxin-antitoxin system
MRVVLDTNVIISALLFGGNPQTILDLVSEGEVQLVTSSPLFSELKRILEDKFRLSPHQTTPPLADLWAVADVVTPGTTLRVFKGKDEPDNRVLECAIAGRVEAVITGDGKILRLKQYRGIPILTPERFLNTL